MSSNSLQQGESNTHCILNGQQVNRTPQFLYMFIHGWACSMHEYRPLMEHFTAEYPNNSCVAVSVAEVAAASGPTPTHTVAEYARLINALRSQLCDAMSATTPPPAVVMAGHSLGSRVALEAIRQSPKGIAGYIAIDGSNSTLASKQAILDRLPAQRDADAAINADVAAQEAAIHSSNPALPVPPSRFMALFGPATPTAFKQAALETLAALPMPYGVEYMRSAREWDTTRYAATMESLAQNTLGRDVHVLILSSTEGHSGSKVRLRQDETNALQDLWRATFEAHSASARCWIVTLDECCHWPHVDDPARTARVLSRFERDALVK